MLGNNSHALKQNELVGATNLVLTMMVVKLINDDDDDDSLKPKDN